MKAIGPRRWVIAEGYIPSESAFSARALTRRPASTTRANREVAKDYVRVNQCLAYHAAQPGRGTKYPANGSARIIGEELVSAVDKQAN